MDPETFKHARVLAHEAKEQIWAAHRHDPNFVGTGFGPKMVRGVQTDTPALIVSVVRKLPVDQLPPTLVLPTSVRVADETLAVDVLETGIVRAL